MIFVTGGTGFIGSLLLKHLLNEKHKVKALHRNHFPTNLTEEERQSIDWVQGDVLDAELLYEQMEGIRQVYHCAAVVSFDSRKREEMNKINIRGTANLVNAALENSVNRLVHLSSVSSLGRNDDQKTIHETTDWIDGKHNSQYAISKRLSELEVWRGFAEGLQGAIVNPGIVLGEGNWNKGSCGLFKTVYEQFPFFTQGETSFVDVFDVVKSMILLMGSDINEERFIISSGNFSYKYIFDQMAWAFGKKSPHILAKPWMTAFIARWFEIKKYLSSAEQTISLETARSAQSVYKYNNEKFLKAFPAFKYTPIEECIDRACRFYAQVKTAS